MDYIRTLFEVRGSVAGGAGHTEPQADWLLGLALTLDMRSRLLPLLPRAVHVRARRAQKATEKALPKAQDAYAGKNGYGNDNSDNGGGGDDDEFMDLVLLANELFVLKLSEVRNKKSIVETCSPLCMNFSPKESQMAYVHTLTCTLTLTLTLTHPLTLILSAPLSRSASRPGW